MYIGAAYYPELWDEREIEQDITRCKEFGINCLRISEFAWGKMEPREGEYDFSYFLSVVDRLYKAGIAVVMCTPTCTPPRWFLDKYEETRSVNVDGKRQEVSSRCHPCKTSPIMRAKNREIVTEMAKVFGSHPGIVGWQIDNEFFHYGGGCFCPLCQDAFKVYLEKKYGTIEKLNREWGMARWSLDYPSFDHVLPPRDSQWRHPSLRTEWRRFQCEQIYTYIDEQAEILHKYTNAPVGTDMMSMNTLSYYRATKNLDVVQFNHYDTADRLCRKAFDYDFLRPIKPRPFWVTETQVGWNGSEYAALGYRPEGNCYLNTWMPIAMGADMNMYWLFRTHAAGHEMAHGALFSTCGRAYKVSDEVKKASDHILACEDFLNNSAVRSDIAIHFSSVSEHNFESAPMLEKFNYRKYVHAVHEALRNRNIDVIDTEHTLDGYKIVISPFLSAIDSDTRERICRFVEEGGTWIVGPMSDIMTDHTSKPTHAPFFFLEEYVGVYTKYQRPINNDVFKASWNDGEEVGVSLCFDAYEPMDSRSLATYTEGEYQGYSVVTERRVGKGRVILVGSMLSADGWQRLVEIEPICDTSENVKAVARSGERSGLILMELENKEGYAQIEGKYRILPGGEEISGRIDIKPYQVIVLEKA